MKFLPVVAQEMLIQNNVMGTSC